VKPLSGRAFEHTVRASFGNPEGGTESPRPRKFYYERLMQVFIRHTYYNATADACPDFDISPTPASATLMSDLGLLFRYEKTGFSVLYDVARADVLMDYLERQGDEAQQCWTRLSFTFTLNNPYFINFTDVPIDVNPNAQNFYFTNREARGVGGRVVLNAGEGVAGGELLRVVPTQVALRVAGDVTEVLVTDLSGEVVIRQPGCPPASPPEGRRDDDAPETCVVYLDFSALPEDKYFIEVVGGETGRRFPVLYTVPSPAPLCFVDLFFTDPDGSDEGVYPVTDLYSPSRKVDTVSYELGFRARATIWNYFIVPQPQAESFEELRIETVSEPAVVFAGPCRVRLPNGADAYRFSSAEELLLQQQSVYRFRLLGRRGLMLNEGCLIETMPVASSRQVTPLSRATACALLRESLYRKAEQRRRCRDLTKLVCRGVGRKPRRPRADDSEMYNYSDTYVYV
jgi:hypothetical protein